MTFVTFQGLTVDKDGNKTEMGRIGIATQHITGVLECVDKHDVVIRECCSILFVGGGQLTIKGKLEDILEQIQGTSYGQQL